MSVLISVPIAMAISQYSNLNHACGITAITGQTKLSQKERVARGLGRNIPVHGTDGN